MICSATVSPEPTFYWRARDAAEAGVRSVLAPKFEGYAMLALRQLGASGVHVDIGDLSLSVFGRFRAESIKIPIGTEADKQAAIKIAETKGKIGILGALLGDKYDARAEAARIIAQAREAAEAEAGIAAQRAKEALRDQVAQLAVAGAEKILRKEINAQAHADLLANLKQELQ